MLGNEEAKGFTTFPIIDTSLCEELNPEVETEIVAEKNLFKYALFVSFFRSLLQDQLRDRRICWAGSGDRKNTMG